jgi:hypothetical protein
MGSRETCHKAIFEATGRTTMSGDEPQARRYPLSHWMPAGNWRPERAWDVVNAESVERLDACCKSPDAAGCITVPITGGQR